MNSTLLVSKCTQSRKLALRDKNVNRIIDKDADVTDTSSILSDMMVRIVLLRWTILCKKLAIVMLSFDIHML
jgi:hypothetical protein